MLWTTQKWLHTHTLASTHSFKFQFECHIWHRKYCLMKPSIHEHAVEFSVNYYLWLFSVDFVQWTTAISQLIVMQCLSVLQSTEMPTPSEQNSPLNLMRYIATSSRNTLFGSRLDKPSAGHHNCVELEKQPDDVRETSSAVQYSEHSRDGQVKIVRHKVNFIFYAVQSSDIKRIWG